MVRRTHASHVLKDISKLVRPDKPFQLGQIYLGQEDLAGILYDLVMFDGNILDSELQRPAHVKNANSVNKYRERMSQYIEEKTGIFLPVSPIISGGFYDAVADFCRI
jgi:hypothetical protein